MKKSFKIIAIVVGSLLLLMLLLPFAFQGKIAGIVKSEGNKMLHAEFDFKRLDISLFRNFPHASISLSNFWIKGIGEFANDTLAQAGEVTATVNLLSLFGDSGYDISKILIEDTKVRAIILADGRANWDIMKPDTTAIASKPEGEATQEESSFQLLLQRFIIKNMDLVYDDRQANRYADISKLDVLLSGDLASSRTTLQVEAEAKALTYKMDGISLLSNANLSTRIDVDADLINHKYTLKENLFRLNAIQAGIDGWVALLPQGVVDMDLKLNTNEIGFKEILSLIPTLYTKDFEGLKTDGTATLNAFVKGTMPGDSLVPQFDVAMTVKNAMFRYPSLPAGVDQININATIKNSGGNLDLTTVSIHPFSFRLAENPFSLTAEVKTPMSDPDFRAEAKGVLNLGMIKQVFPLDGMELNGIINANMQLSGRLSHIEKEQYDKVQAAGTIGLTNMKLKMMGVPDVEIHKSLFTFTPKYLQLSETTVNIGKNDLTTDCRFENYIGYALKGTTLKGSLNVRSNYLNLNDFITNVAADSTATKATTPTTEPTSNTAVAPKSIIEVPRNIDFQMDANLKQVLFDKMTFDQMNGKLLVKEGKVEMKNLSMNTLGGSVVMNGYYSTADISKPEMNAGFKLSNLSFAQTYKELDMVQQMAPIFESLKGDFSGEMNVQTLLDATMSPVLTTLQSKGSLSTKEFSLSGVKVIDQIAEAVKKPSLKEMKVKDMTIDFSIKDGRVATKPFDIKLGEYVMNLSGSTGLDQTIDYIGKVKLPASTGEFAKLSLIDLQIGGTFASPRVSLDTKSMTNQTVEAVTDKAISELGKKLGLDSAITANKDSLKQKVTEKATEKALDFLKKKLK